MHDAIIWNSNKIDISSICDLQKQYYFFIELENLATKGKKGERY